MPTYQEIPAQKLRAAAAADPSHPIVKALRDHIVVQVMEYDAAMGRALDEMKRALVFQEVDRVKVAVDDHAGALHCRLELEDLLALLPDPSQSHTEA
jgi:hypothetical protein